MPQGVYVIENTLTGDVYVGSTRTLAKRNRRHFRELEQGIHHSTYLQRAYAKYGADAFVFRVVEEVLDANMLIEREQHWIETLKPTYNMNPLATNSLGMKVSEETKQRLLHYSLSRTPEQRRLEQLGKKRSEETKKKMSEKASQRKHTEESKQKMAERKRGRTLSAETRKKMSEARKGHTFSEESIEQIRQSNLGKKRSDEARANISEAHKGIKRSEESRRKQSETLKAKHRQAKALDIQQDSLFD